MSSERVKNIKALLRIFKRTASPVIVDLIETIEFLIDKIDRLEAELAEAKSITRPPYEHGACDG